MRDYGIRYIIITTAHPASNGLIEQFNCTLKHMIMCFINELQNDWTEYLQDVVFSYNTSAHLTTGITPFKLMYGRIPKLSNDGRIGVVAHRAQNDPNNRWRELNELKNVITYQR